MNKKFTPGHWLAYMIMAVPAVYLANIYAGLPETIPTHFGLHGADKWSEKAQAWVFILIMTGTSLFTYLLIKNLSIIDPKKNANEPGSLTDKIAMLVVVFLTVLQIIIILAMEQKPIAAEKLSLPVTSLFFVAMGNMMMHIKPNYFVGIRVPWTLESEDNWRKTHRFAGKLWFAVGIPLTIITLLIPMETAMVIFLAGVGVIAIIPIAYSYLYFRKQQKNQ